MNHHQQLLKEIAGTNNLTYSKKIACAIGMGKAVIFGRIAFWAAHNSMESNKKSTHFHFDMWWMYNSIRKWVLDIEHLAKSTIEAYLNELLELRLIHSGKFNKTINTTLWYTINDKAFEHFMALWEQHGRPRCGNGTGQTKKYQAFIDDWKTNHAPHYALVVYTHEHKVSCITGQQNDEGVLYNRTGGVLPDRTTIPVPQSVPQKRDDTSFQEDVVPFVDTQDDGESELQLLSGKKEKPTEVIGSIDDMELTDSISSPVATNNDNNWFAEQNKARKQKAIQNGGVSTNPVVRGQGNYINLTDLADSDVARVVIAMVQKEFGKKTSSLSAKQHEALHTAGTLKDGRKAESPQWYYDQYPKQFREYIEDYLPDAIRNTKGLPQTIGAVVTILSKPDHWHGWLRYADEHGLSQGAPAVVNYDTGEDVEEQERLETLAKIEASVNFMRQLTRKE